MSRDASSFTAPAGAVAIWITKPVGEKGGAPRFERPVRLATFGCAAGTALFLISAGLTPTSLLILLVNAALCALAGFLVGVYGRRSPAS